VGRPLGVLVRRRHRRRALPQGQHAGRVAQDIPTNHNARFAPVIHPTLETGVQAITTVALDALAARLGT
jgi:hypothetical protein